MEHFGVFRQVNKHLAKERNTSTAQTRRAAIRKRTTIAPGTTRKTTPGLAPAITPSSYTEDDYIHDFFTFLMEYPTNELALLLDAKQKCAQINADQAVNWVCDMRLLMSLRNREQKQRLCGWLLSV